jgi:hypothetical protein
MSSLLPVDTVLVLSADFFLGKDKSRILTSSLGIGRKVSNESVIKIANSAVLLGSDNHTGVGVALTGIFMSTPVESLAKPKSLLAFCSSALRLASCHGLHVNCGDISYTTLVSRAVFKKIRVHNA